MADSKFTFVGDGVLSIYKNNMMKLKHTKKRIIFIQPTVPQYRMSFFEEINSKSSYSIEVYSSNMNIGAISQKNNNAKWLRSLGNIQSIFPKILWQKKALKIPIKANDLVIISSDPHTITNILLLIKAKRSGAKTMLWGHYWSSSSQKWRAFLRLKLLHFSDSALFYTDKEVSEYKRAYPNRIKSPVYALNNGINNQIIKKIRAVYDPNMRQIEALFIGRLTDKSKIELLFKALKEISNFKIILHIIGDSSNMRHKIYREISGKLGLNSQIKWHGGVVDEQKIAMIANKCRLFVYPGAVGLSLIHALSYGLPVIIHNNRWGHMPEVAAFKEGCNGMSFEENSIHSLASTIEVLIQDKSRLIKMSEAAIQLTNKTFNTDDMASRFVEAATSILNK